MFSKLHNFSSYSEKMASSGDIESPAAKVEIVNLLKEIKELLKVQNNQFRSTQLEEIHPENELSLAIVEGAAGKSRRQSQSDGSPSSSESRRKGADDSSQMHLDVRNRTGYYEENYYYFGTQLVYDYVNTRPPAYQIVEGRMPPLTAGPDWKYCKHHNKILMKPSDHVCSIHPSF